MHTQCATHTPNRSLTCKEMCSVGRLDLSSIIVEVFMVWIACNYCHFLFEWCLSLSLGVFVITVKLDFCKLYRVLNSFIMLLVTFRQKLEICTSQLFHYYFCNCILCVLFSPWWYSWKNNCSHNDNVKS